MYTAYIIHIIFPVPAAEKLWQLVLEATNNAEYVTSDNGSGWVLSNPNWAIPVGFLFVSVIALTITWPMGYAIRSIPGFKRVLN